MSDDASLLRLFSSSLVALSLVAGGCASSSGDVGESAAAETAVNRIHHSPGFAAANGADRAKIDRVARGVGQPGKTSLAEVLEGDGSRLSDIDKDGQSTLDDLVSLVESPSHPKIAALSSGFTAAAIKEAVLADLAHPENIHQGHF